MSSAGRLLFIDDNPMVLDIARMVLEPEGFEVLTSPSALCSGLILEKKPDVVFLDIKLMGVQGDTAGKAMMSVPEISNGRCLVVFHSNMPIEVLKKKAADSGVAGYMHKQDDPGAFLREVRRWVALARSKPR